MCRVYGTEAAPIAFNVIPCGYPPQTSSPAHNTPMCPGIIDETECPSHLCTSCHNRSVLDEAYRENQREKQARKDREEEQRAREATKEDDLDEVDKFFRELEESEAAEAATAASRENSHTSDSETEWEDVIIR
ncbi:hypothetical protein MRS44_016641 [Fusarium solani]|uniref:uncharacterized protein n=1 Tax=Fusarium solani TaxID=169388 RepID=UPI0032C4460C|nr:hypothetical protein MRS44_016641 [Fusarium solani]